MNKMRKRGIGGVSSLLVSFPNLIAFFCFMVVAGVFRQPLIAGFCLFVFLICALSRLWGAFSIRKLSIAIEALSVRSFIGEEFDIRFSIQNDKLLPLIWLELLLPMPRRLCIMPDEGFEEAVLSAKESDCWEGGMALKKRFSFIMGRESLEWRGRWVAKRRGVYHLDRLVLLSGDGFGLTQSQRVDTPVETPIIVVYPKVRPVDITHFLSAQWDSSGGNRGFMDDLTVMRGMRRYEAGDSWKQINWRMAARQQELSVKLYDTITPKAIHFIVDGESFCSPELGASGGGASKCGANAVSASEYGASGKGDCEFEDALSLLASLMLRLTEAHVLCGLSLPRSKYLPHTDIAATADAVEILTALAGYDMLAERDEKRSLEAQRDVFLPSDFDYPALARAAHFAGRIYYIMRDAAGLRQKGLPQELDISKLVLLPYREASEEDIYTLGIRSMRLGSFGR